MSLLNEFRIDIGDDEDFASIGLSGISPTLPTIQSIGPDIELLVRDLRVDSGDDDSVDFASGIQVGSLSPTTFSGPDILSEIRDLRVDIGDDDSVDFALSSGIGSLPNVSVIGPEVLTLLRDFRVDIGDDDGLTLPISSGFFPTQGPLCWNTTIVNTASYTAQINDVLIYVNPVVPFTTINLPPVGQLGCSYIIKDISGMAFDRNIVVNPGSNTIDGFNIWVITQNYQSITITWIGSGWGII